MAIVLPKFSRRRPPTGLAAETQPAVNVSLCRDDGRYEAGRQLSAKWRVRRVPLQRVQGLEVSVLWYTEGKGDEDLHVHHFHRLTAEQLRRTGLADEQSLRCQLPATPLSYHGQLIQIRWCIRLRLFIDDGREIVAEQPFHLVAHGQAGSRAPLPGQAHWLARGNSSASRRAENDSPTLPVDTVAPLPLTPADESTPVPETAEPEDTLVPTPPATDDAERPAAALHR